MCSSLAKQHPQILTLLFFIFPLPLSYLYFLQKATAGPPLKFLLFSKEVDIIKKTGKQAKITKTEHGMGKAVQNQGQSPKKYLSRVNTDESAVKRLAGTDERNILNAILNHLHGPG
ncbi:hypothetical protein Tco_0206319 [Tanacetum coccineum]